MSKAAALFDMHSHAVEEILFMSKAAALFDMHSHAVV
jgi:cupin superfamily acireductone dioxygenase involved in methionine salvage